jgi:hypothetical protein
MFLVAGKAAQAFVDTDGSAVVTRSDLAACGGCVALIAERLPQIRTDLHRASACVHLREREAVERDVVLLPTVE